MPQFDILTFTTQFLGATVFFFSFYLIYTRYFLTQIFYSIRFRQKLLLLDSKFKTRIKSSLLFTEILKAKGN